MKMLYRCYSENLKQYLQENGQSYELKAIDIKTDVPFYAYLNTDRLEYLLANWRKPQEEKNT